MITELFLAWQDPDTRRWFAVGRLGRNCGVYQFGYLQGAQEAETQAGFQPLMAFPRLDHLYESAVLFPFFATRMMPESRPDFATYMEWLGLEVDDADPFQILSRSEAVHATDNFRLFAGPQIGGDAVAQVVFPVHGFRHASDSSQTRALQLSPNERLLIMKDVQNPQDEAALALRTSESTPRDMHLMGYCPRYYAREFGAALDGGAKIVVTVERVNPEPAPWNLRVMVRASVSGFMGEWMSSPEYCPLAVPVSA